MDTYAALREEFRKRGYYEKATARIVGQLAIHIMAILGGFAMFMGFDSLLVRGVGILLAAVGSIGAFTNGHTASHYATSSKKWFNELLTFFTYPFIGQVSASYWWHKHIVGHHPAPNVIDVDGDIDLMPYFAYTEEDLAKSRGLLRLYYKLQWLVIPLAIGLLGFEVQIYGWVHLIRCLRDRKNRKAFHWVDLGAMALHWVFWYVIPMLFFPVPAVLLFNLGRCILSGYGMFAVFAPAHFPAEAVALDKSEWKKDRVLLQTATTVNFRTGPLGRLLCAGVDYQIEHHLFAGISHVYYPELSPLVEDFCQRHGYPYRTLGWGEAIWKAYWNFCQPKKVEAQVEALRVPVQHCPPVRIRAPITMRRTATSRTLQLAS